VVLLNDTSGNVRRAVLANLVESWPHLSGRNGGEFHNMVKYSF
jgi:hypothetical protein